MKDLVFLIRLINLFSGGEFRSNQQIIEELNIDYITIQKCIKIINKWGMTDVIVKLNYGYQLCETIQLLDEVIIKSYLSDNNRLVILPVVNSTNQYLINRISSLKNGDICLAEYQTNGRGKIGRKWISAFGSNICFSFYWCFKYRKNLINHLSVMITSVIADVLYRFDITEIYVKWPNDLFLKNRKLAGVLVETIGRINDVVHVIIGVGINFSMRRSVPDLINQNWINLEDAGITTDRNVLIAELVKAIHLLMKEF